MLQIIKKVGLITLLTAPVAANADLINFFFTGQLTVAGGGNGAPSTGPITIPISANLAYDTISGIGNSNLSIDPIFFSGIPISFHDISMQREGSSNIIAGSVLFSLYDLTANHETFVEWDATGLFNAIDIGLQAGDVISGTNLLRDGNFFADVNSATPFADSIPGQTVIQNFAPIAATGGTNGVAPDNAFTGVVAYFDIGSGNSLHVTSVSSSVVPVPAAAWLFGSGLIGLIGVARRKA